MVGVTPTNSLSSAKHFYAVTHNPSSLSSSSSSSTTTPLTFHQIIHGRVGFHYSSNHFNGRRRRIFSIKAYIENTNSLSNFASKIIGSLPVVGLIARIISDEGGVGGDIIDFAEFRRRVGKKCTFSDSKAFYEFQDRRGRAGDSLHVLLCCWLAAVGAGLLKSEDILEGVARLRLSNDIEFEEQNFLAMMNEARERRAKLRAVAPAIPMEIRAAKALDAIYVCCFGKDPLEEDDERLLNIMLCAVFPTVRQADIQEMIKEKAKEVAEGVELEKSPVKPLSKEAVERQMKDLQFLKQNSAELLERKNES